MALEYTQEQLNNLVDNGSILVEDLKEGPIYLFEDGNISEIIKASKICHVITSDPYGKIGDIMPKIDLGDSINFFIDKKEKGKDYKEYNEDFFFSEYNNSMISYLKYKENNKEVCRLNCEGFDKISDIIKIVEEFKKNNIQIDILGIRLLNKDYEDIELLKDIEKEYKTEISYGASKVVEESEDFLVMRETINYYKELIQAENLSPLEQLIYAYDLIKSYEYNASESENDLNSRQIHLILKSGKIVCKGYSVFIEQLLNELGIETITISTQGKEPHARNVVKLKDEKYGIDGLFAIDATWDSAKNLIKVVTEDGREEIKKLDSKEDGEVIEKYYDNLSLYRCFLIPLSDYYGKFRTEEYQGSPSDNDELIKEAEPYLTYYDLKPRVACNNRTNFDKIIQAIAVVRLKEGYSKEATIESIKGIIEINDYYDKSKSDELETAVIKNNF